MYALYIYLYIEEILLSLASRFVNIQTDVIRYTYNEIFCSIRINVLVVSRTLTDLES